MWIWWQAALPPIVQLVSGPMAARPSACGVPPPPEQAMAAPSDLERLFHYMRDFEMAFLSGQWSLLDAHFREDARHTIDGGGGPLGSGGHGREAVVAGLRGGVEAIDRRFDVRIPEIVEGPVTRGDAVWMRFALTLRRVCRSCASKAST
jgi:hypothetical protein